jgi:periplasmic copper chaperone A
MRMPIKRIKVALFLGLLALAFSAQALEVRDAWIPEAPPAARVLAGYMVIQNPSAEPQTLVRVLSLQFGNIMIHNTVQEGEIARMVHMDSVEIPPGQTLTFEPGGLHLMLMHPEKPLREGDIADITLRFASGMQVPVEFRVRKAAAAGAGGHHHH